jgi:uncharacterized membrane protein
MPSRTTVILAVSLALNAALIGVAAGGMLNPKRAPAADMRFERYGPTSDVVQAAWAQLPDDDRQELRKQLREQWQAMAPDRERLKAAGKAVYDAALADPFDETRLRDALIVFQWREAVMQGRAEDILIKHLKNMPPEARATAAVGLLTPFNARMQRADRPRGAAADGAEPDARARSEARAEATN